MRRRIAHDLDFRHGITLNVFNVSRFVLCSFTKAHNFNVMYAYREGFGNHGKSERKHTTEVDIAIALQANRARINDDSKSPSKLVRIDTIDL